MMTLWNNVNANCAFIFAHSSIIRTKEKINFSIDFLI
jgi:hypothetical protein